MRLPTAFALLLLLCGPAVAQTPPPTPPAPRVTLDVALPPPPDHRLSGVGPPGRPCRRRRWLDLRRDLELPAIARRRPAGQERAHRAFGLLARGHAEVSHPAAGAGGRRAERFQCRVA